MPLYEYECGACGHRFERIQKFSDPLVRKCPKCRKKRVEKLLSAPAVQFKGSGWYVTDYARKGASSARPDSEKPKEKGTMDTVDSGKKETGKESRKSGGKD